MGEKGQSIINASLKAYEMFFDHLKELTTIRRLWQNDWRQDPFKLYLISDRLSGPELAQKLQDEFAIYAEMSDASGTNLLDVSHRCWSEEILKKLHIDKNLLPPLLESSDPAGRVTAEAAAATGLCEGTVVAAGGGDNACAAVGQCELMYTYDRLFNAYNHTVAQILLTGVDVEHTERRVNFQNTLSRLLELGALPIINENDTVATDEITSIGDNDTLAAIVACCAKADMLVLLSDIDGLYTANPHTHTDAKLIPLVEEITPEVMALADGAGSALGTGGMATKLRAARMVTGSGADMVIANGAHPELLYDIAAGRSAGTRFAARKED